MQTPQGLDAQHGGELFPVKWRRLNRFRRECLTSPTREKPGADRTGVEILGTARGHGSVANERVCRIYAVRRFG
jgi:hypothetical protein